MGILLRRRAGLRTSSVPVELLESRHLLSGIQFPPGSNVIDVAAVYGAIPSDGIDDTVALQQAITQNVDRGRVLYLRDGIYNLTDRLDWGTGGNVGFPFGHALTLQGQSEAGTILRLRDNDPLFQNPATPRPLLDVYNGNTANAFRNYIQDLTVDVGAGNPGAIGIEFQANNVGAMRNVTIRSSDPASVGVVGLNQVFNFPGPLLLQNITIDGFDEGYAGAPQEYSATFDNLTLRNQRVRGIGVWRLPLQIRNLVSTNSVPVLQSNSNPGGWGHVVIDGATITGTSGAATQSAFIGQESSGVLLLRNASVTGYANAVADFKQSGAGDDTFVPSGVVSQYSTQAANTVFASPAGMLEVPAEPSPFVTAPLSEWVSVTAFGAVPNDNLDDTAGVQAAMDFAATTPGKSVVYFPQGGYLVSDTITIGGNIRRVTGLTSFIGVQSGLYQREAGLFRLNPGQPVVQFDSFNISGEGLGRSLFLEHQARNTVIIRDSGASGYRNTVRGGTVFIDNVTGRDWRFDGQSVFARQFNPEGGDGTFIINDGGALNILGLKTEGNSIVLETRNGGRTQVLGGLIYPSEPILPRSKPAFVVTEASLSFSLAESSSITDGNYEVWVRETRNGITDSLTRSDPADQIRGGRLGGANISLFNGYVADATPPSPLSGLSGSATQQSVTLTWNASSDPQTGIAAYQVFGMPGMQLLGSTAGTSFVVAGVPDAFTREYQVVPVNGAGLAGAGAALTVTTPADTTPPRVLLVRADAAPSRIEVRFAEPVDPVTAGNPANYVLSPAGPGVTGAQIARDGVAVTLTTAAPLPAGVQYTLAVSNVRDRATTPNVIAPAAPAAFASVEFNAGTGLTGTYYDNINFTGPSFTRIDPEINFDFGGGSPGGGLEPDTFSIRWTGSVQPRFTETYTFLPLTDDGVRLWVNGALVVDSFIDQPPTERRGQIDLVGGRKYDLVMEYFENGFGAQAQLRWQSPSTPRQVIPSSQLYPQGSPTPTVVTIRTAQGRGADTTLENNIGNPPNPTDNGAGQVIGIYHDPSNTFSHASAYIRLDLAGLDLVNNDIVDATLLSTLVGGFGTGSGIRELNVFGVNDSAPNADWVETGPGFVSRLNAPSFSPTGGQGDPASSTYLGKLRVDNTGFGLAGQRDGLTLRTPALLNFVRADTDGLVTIFFKRVDASNEGTNFIAKELDPTRAAGLRLTLAPRPVPITAAPDLLPGTDSGDSATDNLTRFNNGPSSLAPRFAVAGTTPGAVVRVYADGVLIGSAVAMSAVTEVQAFGAVPLPDGVRGFTATQQPESRPESGPSGTLAVTVDTLAPSLVAGQFLFETQQQIRVEVSEVLSQSPAFTLQNLTTGTAASFVLATPGPTEYVMDPGAPGLFADGNYRLSVPLLDRAGNAAAAPGAFDFFVLAGDANRDRSVNIADFSALAARFNQPGTFSQGDFNYTGTVEIGDFSILAAKFNTTLPAPEGLPRSNAAAGPGAGSFGALGDEIRPLAGIFASDPVGVL